MDRDILVHIPTIMAVARHRGFAAAAKDLRMSPSAVSHAVRTVEEKLGLPLFSRTTRSVALTDWGAAFVQSVAPALEDISEAADRVRSARGQVSGHLRLNVPKLSIPIAVGPVVKEMTKRYPDLTVEVFCDDGLSDIVEGRFDAGVRLGSMIAEDMITVPVTNRMRGIICGAPDYLTLRGVPETLEDLQYHACITYRKAYSGAVFAWPLMDGTEETVVEVKAPLIVNDIDFALELALDGLGLGYFFEELATPYLKTGQLQQVLPYTAYQYDAFYLYFTKRAGRTPKLRAFIDTAKDILTLKK